jgi:hypothetical protein
MQEFGGIFEGQKGFDTQKKFTTIKLILSKWLKIAAKAR